MVSAEADGEAEEVHEAEKCEAVEGEDKIAKDAVGVIDVEGVPTNGAQYTGDINYVAAPY